MPVRGPDQMVLGHRREEVVAFQIPTPLQKVPVLPFLHRVIHIPQKGDAGCEAVLLQEAADRNVGVLPSHGADPLRGGLLWLRGLCLRSRLPGRLRLCRFAAGFAGLDPRRGFRGGLPKLLDSLQGRAAAH